MSQYTQQPQFPQAPTPAAQARNGLGTAALILGIIGALSGLVPFLFWLAGILGVIALVMGLAGRGRAKRGGATNKGVALTGAILGLVSLILSVVGAVILFKAVDDAVKDLDKATSSSSAGTESSDGSAKGGAKGKNSGKGAGTSGDSGADSQTLEAGDSAVYDDKLTLTMSAPAAYTPGEYSIGHTKGNKAYKVTLVIDNAGKEKFDAALVTTEARAGEEGVKAEQIFDDKVGEVFTGTVMPGKKATVVYAFDTPADAKNLVVEVSPDFSHDASQWELKL
ncbi:hypothetical protein AR457_20815 [Streptomyces agglomeratus]|uniref:DUF4190 domain-containing protein n=1 Tax=Streptomyces agglomeratus TaxID=285458 RepID=UPI00085405F0|nr:DUF4190 domain-containing protein [Streptomyces agglomeratus]OEJ39407.1 hypothetical protein BGK70_15840 [Streptomyces agglomeratus]OEJ46210.1 hypothetical protein AR457_20815 [Streptomyces agglomeratus]